MQGMRSRAKGSCLHFAAAFAMLAALMPLASFKSAAAETADLPALYTDWLEAINRGDVEGASNLFTEDALYEGGVACTPYCHGQDALRRELQALVDERAEITATSVRLSTTPVMRWLTAWTTVRSEGVRAAGVERAIAVTSVGARGDRIVFFITLWDRTDAQTNTFLTAASAPASAADTAATPPVVLTPAAYGRLVDIGGRRMYLECLGEGSPTVVLEGGLNSGAAASRGVWNHSAFAPHVRIQSDLARTTRVCAYDRAGYGLSDPGPLPHTALSITDDLHALLRGAGVEPPYVLAGISFGGPIVQMYANRFPDEIAGLVEIDPSPLPDVEQQVQAVLPPAIAARRQANVQRDNTSMAGPDGPGGGTDIDTFLDQVRQAKVLPRVPLVVLTAGASPLTNPLSYSRDFSPEIIEQINRIRLESQAAIAALVPGGKQEVVDNSDHAMNVYAPQTITDAIAGILQAARLQDSQLTEYPAVNAMNVRALPAITGANAGVLTTAHVQDRQFAEYDIPTPNSRPGGIVVGPDGDIWFAESLGNNLGRIAADGQITEFSLPTPDANIPNQAFVGIGPDGMVWFTESAANKIGRITPAGEIMEFDIPSAAEYEDPTLGGIRTSFPIAIAAGSDGAVWFNERSTSRIGRMTLGGEFSEFSLPDGVGSLVGLTPGPDGALWFVANTPGHIGRITSDGDISVFPIPTPRNGALRLKAGPEGAMWFVEFGANKIGRVTMDGQITEFPVAAKGVGPDIAPGPDGAIWFTVLTDNLIGRITPGGDVSLYPVPTPASSPYWLVEGPDDAIWFTEIAGNKIGRILE